MSEFMLKTATQEPDLATAMQVVYQWNYDPEVEELRNLYVKAAEGQWIGAKHFDWSRPIDLVKFSTTPLAPACRSRRRRTGARCRRRRRPSSSAARRRSGSRSFSTGSRAPSWWPRSS